MPTPSTRRIVLTGCSRGLGRALTAAFVEAGHTVVGCARDKAKIGELSRIYSAPHAFAAVDVTRPDEVNAWAGEILRAGPPDLLGNNAAVINNPAPLWKISTEEFEWLFEVNVLGVANVIRALVPAMVERKKGVIVNLSSGWGRSTSPEVAPYCATKYAIEGMTLALASELPDGMAAVPLNPGVINTDMLRQCFGNGASAYPSPEVWVKAAAPFLLGLTGDDNGQSLTVPGIPTG